MDGWPFGAHPWNTMGGWLVSGLAKSYQLPAANGISMSEDAATTTAPAGDHDEVKARIQEALDEIRPALQFDGGDCELVGWSPDTGVVQLAMVGACSGCGLSTMTLQAGIERIVRERVPEVKAVVNVE